jgi:hypothetical protein
MAQVDMPKSSIGQTPTEPKKKLEKVVKGKVAVKEQSDMQKIASQFLAEDLKTVKDRILTDYLLPMLKNGAWSILNSAFSIALWGEDRSRGGLNNYYGSATAMMAIIRAARTIARTRRLYAEVCKIWISRVGVMLRTLWRVSGTHCTATGRFRWATCGI